MCCSRGLVSALDFGVAKAAPPIIRRAAETGRTELATQAHLTGEGTLVGTVEDMAPEQLEGKELDPRTDIFALGAILYEMVTGRKAFIGDSQASLITAIMSSEPPRLVSIAPMTPPLLDRLIHTVWPSPDDRVQTAQDVLLQLRWIAESSQAGLAAAALPRRRRLWERSAIAWTVSAMALVVAVGAVWFALARGRSDSRLKDAVTVRSTILLPERVTLDNAVISPDGKRIVFSGRDRTGRSQLWLRRLDTDDATPLAGTEGGLLPFWSPDSRHIGFFAAFPDKKLRRVDASRGAPLSLYDVDGVGGAWSPSDDILFSAPTGPILRIPAAGGHATPVTTLNVSRGETAHRYPFLLPDGRHFLYFAMNVGGSRRDSANRIWVGSLDGGKAKPLILSSFNAQYSNGHLLYIRGGDRGGSLVAQPFDPYASRRVVSQ